MTDIFHKKPSSISSTNSDDSLPSRRIKLKGDKVMVGGQHFTSASDALRSYLQQFNPSKPGPVSIRPLNGVALTPGTVDAVNQLLTSKATPQAEQEVTDALKEVKLRKLLRQAARKSQGQAKTGLQQEVEDALVRSAQLLERVTRDDSSSAKSCSDTSSDSISISTETLLATNPLEPTGIKDQTKQGHVYSYRSQKQSARNHGQSSLPPVSYSGLHSLGQSRTGSVDSLIPAKRPQRSSRSRSASLGPAASSNLGNHPSHSSETLTHLRSRSVSPGSVRRHRSRERFTDAMIDGRLEKSVSKSVPSWVGEMAPSELSDSIWLSRSVDGGRPPPSWISEAEKSDVTLDKLDSKLLHIKALASEVLAPSALADTTSDHQGHTFDSRPGLNFSDLATSGVSASPSKHVTFGDKVNIKDIISGKGELSESNQAKAPAHENGEKSPGSFNGESFLRKNILPQTAKLKKSVDEYLQSSGNLRHNHGAEDDVESRPRCSSLDTLALLTGKLPDSSVSGISHIPRTNSNERHHHSDLSLSSDIPNGARLEDGSDTDGLGGDRPWEAMTNSFKPPVPVPDVDQLSQNGRVSPYKGLSGGKQPGSMEALKNMLFRLQAEESSTQNGSNEKTGRSGNDSNSHSASNGGGEKGNTSSGSMSQQEVALIPALKDYNFKGEPGGHSLEKALVHLNRLKSLVQTTGPTAADPDGSLKEVNQPE